MQQPSEGKALERVEGPNPPKDEACLYAALICPRKSHDRLLRELVGPIVREIRGDPWLDSLFFIRYDDPDWQLRIRVLGRRDWVEGLVRAHVERALAPFVAEGAIREVRFGTYEREWERYGGEMGMRLAEKIFFHDSLACLELLDAEEKGGLARSRREWSLLLTERFLNLFDFDAAQRLAFYRTGHEWAFRDGVFKDEDVPRLQRHYLAVREGLRELVFGESGDDPDSRFGGPEATRIAHGLLDKTRPIAQELLEALAAGKVVQDLGQLVWSYAHLHCNRLGIELVPEAILRYTMFRLYEESC